MTRPEESLFRPEALAFKLTESEGHARLLTPPHANLVIALLLGALIATAVFLFSNEYTRKTTVSGYIQPNNTIKRVVPGRSGTVAEVLVTTGQVVTRDEPLLRLVFPAPFNGSERAKTVMEFEQQIEAISKRGSELELQEENEQARIKSETAAIIESLAGGERILALQRARIQQLKDTLDAASPLFESGKLSRLEWGAFRQSWLEARQAAEQMSATQSERRQKLQQLSIAVAQTTSRYLSEAVLLDQEGSRIKQALHGLMGETDTIVNAPAEGVIANILVEAGDAVSQQQTLVTMMNPDSSLKAVLLIPTRSAGFLEVGLPLNLLYDAFPYQQFGTFKGRITGLSKHALLPGDTTTPVPIREPYFEAEATIETPFVRAYGDLVPLRSGMTLKADIVLDRRSLIDWLLEPLRVMRGRSA